MQRTQLFPGWVDVGKLPAQPVHQSLAGNLDHMQLATPPGREDKARAFYAGILGIAEQAKPPHLARRGGCWFERGALEVHLGVDKDFVPASKANSAFIVEALPALLDVLRRADQPARR